MKIKNIQHGKLKISNKLLKNFLSKNFSTQDIF